MCVFLSRNRCHSFALRRSWCGCNYKWEGENLLLVAGKRWLRQVGEDVAFSFSQNRMGDSACQKSPGTDCQDHTAATCWRTRSSNQAGAIEKEDGSLINCHGR